MRWAGPSWVDWLNRSDQVAIQQSGSLDIETYVCALLRMYILHTKSIYTLYVYMHYGYKCIQNTIKLPLAEFRQLYTYL